MRYVIYSLKDVDGKFVVTIEYSLLIIDIVHKEYLMIDVPVTGIKKFAWYPYIVKQRVFDNGHVFFLISKYKKLNISWVKKHLIEYRNAGRKNQKDYLQI